MDSDNNQKTENNSYSPIWLSISEAANIGGVGDKTIRRALKDKDVLIYKIVKDRYKIEFISLINFLNSNIKLKNKFFKKGLGQYVKEWNK